MCCTGAKWKRERAVVPDHKFDFIDVREFHDTGCFTRFRYAFLYILMIKSFLVYVSDIYTAIAMLASNRWSGNILNQEGAQDSKTVQIPFSIGKWIFTGCIIFSFLLLAYEARKARNIIRSHDISYAYTNVMANNYYSMKSFDHFCFFCQINNSTKKTDDLAFFVFFTFKGWKRLLLADAPRQVINGLTLYSFGKAFNFTTDISLYIGGSVVRAVILVTMIFTVVVWIGSFILLIFALFLYIPLLCHIQGNLKEYCCHKVDKRIAELMKKKSRKRLLKEAALARKEAKGDYSHLKDKKGNLKGAPLAQPTLPKIDLDDDYRYGSTNGSDLSLREKNTYYNAQHSDFGMNTQQNHMYPPVAPVAPWGRYDPTPQAPFGYAGSEVGYEPSLHSADRLLPHEQQHNVYEQHFAPAMSAAPSYRSQASHDGERGHWQDPNAPPLPSHEYHGYHDEKQHDDQFQYETASIIEQRVEQYQPISRDLLYERSQQTRRRHSQQQLEEQRPESEFIDFGAYYQEPEQPQPPRLDSRNARR